MPHPSKARPRLLPDAEIVRLYLDGLDSDSVGYRAGCSGTAVLDLVRAAGGTVRGRGQRSARVTALTDEEICRRYTSGQSGVIIADAAKVSPSTVYAILRRNGVAVRADAAEVAHQAATSARKKRTGKS